MDCLSCRSGMWADRGGVVTYKQEQRKDAGGSALRLTSTRHQRGQGEIREHRKAFSAQTICTRQESLGFCAPNSRTSQRSEHCGQYIHSVMIRHGSIDDDMYRKTRTKHETNDSNKLPVAAKRKSVVLLPGCPTRTVVVTMTLAKTTVLQKPFRNKAALMTKQRLTFLPVLVRPRDSRCLWTGFAIQLMRASRRI